MSDQFNLFGDGDDRLRPPASGDADHEARARARLLAVLETARQADVMPWSERDARMWRTVVPQMADWLPKEEAERLRLAFDREMTRLESA